MTQFTTRPELRGTFGMVASTHWLAAQTGMAMLERGGNAFDAAVAAGFVLHVAEPHQNGPGGDLRRTSLPQHLDTLEAVQQHGRTVRQRVHHHRLQ